MFTDPFGSVVQSGGQVLFVVENGKAVGTCAVIRHDARSFDLAKVSVEPESQGRGYGDLLVKRAIAFARDAGAERLMLLTNSRLTAAVPLYEKHGFRPVTVSHAEHYSRVDLELELRLKAGDRPG